MSKKKKKKKAPTPPPAPAPTPASSPNRLGVAIAVLLLAGLAAAVFFVGRRGPDDPAPASEPEPASSEGTVHDIPVAAHDPVLGPSDAPATIIEFSDFQCPYCRNAARSLKDVRETYGDRVRIVYKNYPLDTSCNPNLRQQVHPLACAAAVAAACAGRQDRFWEMHDAIFALPELTEASLRELPASLGLDLEAFEACQGDDSVQAEVRDDIALGRELGVTGTPTLFVNGSEARDHESLGPMIERVLSGN